jgi:hypothetical protein
MFRNTLAAALTLAAFAARAEPLGPLSLDEARAVHPDGGHTRSVNSGCAKLVLNGRPAQCGNIGFLHWVSWGRMQWSVFTTEWSPQNNTASTFVSFAGGQKPEPGPGDRPGREDVVVYAVDAIYLGSQRVPASGKCTARTSPDGSYIHKLQCSAKHASGSLKLSVDGNKRPVAMFDASAPPSQPAASPFTASIMRAAAKPRVDRGPVASRSSADRPRRGKQGATTPRRSPGVR